jgi:hypothetical protein
MRFVFVCVLACQAPTAGTLLGIVRKVPVSTVGAAPAPVIVEDRAPPVPRSWLETPPLSEQLLF